MRILSIGLLMVSAFALHAMEEGLSKKRHATWENCKTNCTRFVQREEYLNLETELDNAKKLGFDIKELVNTRINVEGETLIFLTLRHKESQVLTLLLQQGASPNAIGCNNRTLLIELCCIPSVQFLSQCSPPDTLLEKVRALVHHNADIDHVDQFKFSAKTLLQRNIQPDMRNPRPNYETCLSIASHNLARKKALEFLVQHETQQKRKNDTQ